MCFSATASFLTVAVTGTAGIVALTRVNRRQDIALAATPLFFAAQQAIEGMLWLTLPTAPGGATVLALTTAFLLFAKVFWPVFIPVAALLVETDKRRQRAITAFLAMGVTVGIYFLWSILNHSPISHTDPGHIVYSGEPEVPLIIKIAYFIVTGLTAMLSSFSSLRLFGGIVLVGSLTSYFFYWEAFSSVWCFFAAAASAVIILHFERVRQVPNAEVG